MRKRVLEYFILYKNWDGNRKKGLLVSLWNAKFKKYIIYFNEGVKELYVVRYSYIIFSDLCRSLVE